jgi:aconitate hydratase
MGAETGVTTSIFPSDKVTRAFLKAQNRVGDYIPLKADKNAEYTRVLQVDLSALEPLAAMPHSPGNIEKVRNLAGKKVDQVAIGSCTNSSLRDLLVVGAILKGKKVHPGTSLVISPGSRQVFSMISRNGTLSSMIDAGARIMESTCGFCIGNGQAPSTNAVSVRTNNRNFEGRCGTQSAGIYLASPETAALCAIKGEFTDPLSEGENAFPEIKVPSRFDVDDSMILAPEPGTGTVDVFRGPNIGPPPVNVPMLDDLRGEVAIKVGDKITTDHIMPAGARLKYRSNIKKYSEYVFEGVDPGFPKKAAALRDSGKAVFIVAGESYGQGSSREHAAICPMYLGVKAVIAKSFERIHSANLVNFGILPLVFDRMEDYEHLVTGTEIELSGILSALENNNTLAARDLTRRCDISLKFSLSRRQRDIIRSGGLLNYTKNDAQRSIE